MTTLKKLRMTASELKYQHELYNPNSHFFDRQTMKFFGDRMSNYYVPASTVSITNSLGEKFICYELQRKRPVKLGCTSSAYFDIATFKRVIPSVM